jgi:hypothetical protein
MLSCSFCPVESASPEVDTASRREEAEREKGARGCLKSFSGVCSLGHPSFSSYVLQRNKPSPQIASSQKHSPSLAFFLSHSFSLASIESSGTLNGQHDTEWEYSLTRHEAEDK